jgi:hypothetical protein
MAIAIRLGRMRTNHSSARKDTYSAQILNGPFRLIFA